MFWVAVALGVCGVIVYVAARIVALWILPREAVLAFEANVTALFVLLFKLLVVALGAFIVYVFAFAKP